MSALRPCFLGSCLLASVLLFSVSANTSEIDQKVVGTFSAPVMIPGQILPSGTYVFKVLDVWSSGNVVQVSTGDGSKVLATAFTVPRYRMNPGDKEIFQFEERGSDSPQAVKAWFYPGRTIGHEFIYSKTTTAEAITSDANDSPAPVASTPSEKSAAVTPEVPNAEEPAPVVEQNASNTAQTQTPASSSASGEEELPKTASSTPLIGVLAILLLGLAGGLKAFAAPRS